MSTVINLDRIKREVALQNWVHDCQGRMNKRYPRVVFNSDLWEIRTLYSTKMVDVSLGAALADLSTKHSSFSNALRCLAAEMALKDEIKSPIPLRALRLLSGVEAETLFEIQLDDIRQIEKAQTQIVNNEPAKAGKVGYDLSHLSKHLSRLSAKGVIDRLVYTVGLDTKRKMYHSAIKSAEMHREKKAQLLDQQIEAFSEALNALFSNDPRLSTTDRMTLAFIGLEMCAPSRINEILCLSIDDYVNLEDYAVRAAATDSSRLHAVHQMLITMKGSKGAQWGAKPILNFMIGLFNYCLDLIIDHGKRSRMLASWYELNPNKLYLTEELEYLRGQDLEKCNLWRVINLSNEEVSYSQRAATKRIFKALSHKVKLIDNPRSITVRGHKNSRSTVKAIPWEILESYLLSKVHEAQAEVRRVTKETHYEGRLSKMLALQDVDETPFLPGSLKYSKLMHRVKQTHKFKVGHRERRGADREPTIFEKLNITMPVNGKAEFAWIETHDPRRWLTTEALKARERLSDVLINKWARRIKIDQLKHYDLRTSEEKAQQAAMPTTTELIDLSHGISTLQGVEIAFGLKSEIVVAHDAGVSITSMDAILSSVQDRPVAKTSDQLLILYPSQFGACVHQHHETPCRSYGSCLPCDNNLVVKGHFPTNDAIRKRKDKLYESILLQLRSLAIAHNRGIADDSESLSSHLLTLASAGLNPQDMATHLIERFHEIKHLVKDVCLAIKIEEAFVATGMVARLDDANISNGALMKYHNPTRHSAPGLERAIDANGGHAEMATRIERVISIYPQFKPTVLGLKDERHLVEPDQYDAMDREDE